LKNEEKRKLFEDEQAMRLKKLRDESIRRSEEIRKVLSSNAALEEKKRDDYYKKFERA